MNAARGARGAFADPLRRVQQGSVDVGSDKGWSAHQTILPCRTGYRDAMRTTFMAHAAYAVPTSRSGAA
ncbi:hypothetical protein GCM10027444_33440 [Actinopolyspora lacussalsi]